MARAHRNWLTDAGSDPAYVSKSTRRGGVEVTCRDGSVSQSAVVHVEVGRVAHLSLVPVKHPGSDSPLTYYAGVGSQRCLKV
jgi:hypothetical protein